MNTNPDMIISNESEFEVGLEILAASIDDALKSLRPLYPSLTFGLLKGELGPIRASFSCLDIYFLENGSLHPRRFKIKSSKSGKFKLKCDLKYWDDKGKRELVLFRGRKFDDPFVLSLAARNCRVTSIVLKHCRKFPLHGMEDFQASFSAKERFFRIEEVRNLDASLSWSGQKEIHTEIEVSTVSDRARMFKALEGFGYLRPLRKRHKYLFGQISGSTASLFDVISIFQSKVRSKALTEW
jgi:hypothetical protein